MPCPCWKFIIFNNITLVSVHYFKAKEFSLGAGRDEVGEGCARFAKKNFAYKQNEAKLDPFANSPGFDPIIL